MFVVRCVLPHIPQPWMFLDRLGRGHPGSLALIEFQRPEWFLQEHMWYPALPRRREPVRNRRLRLTFRGALGHGMFAAGELGWVLMQLTPDRAPARPRPRACVEDFRELLAHRQHMLDAFRDAETPTRMWGLRGRVRCWSTPCAKPARRLNSPSTSPLGVTDSTWKPPTWSSAHRIRRSRGCRRTRWPWAQPQPPRSYPRAVRRHLSADHAANHGLALGRAGPSRGQLSREPDLKYVSNCSFTRARGDSPADARRYQSSVRSTAVRQSQRLS